MTYQATIFRSVVFTVWIAISVSMISSIEGLEIFNANLSESISSLTASLLGALGMQVISDGAIIQSGDFAARIATVCTPIYSWILFTGGVLVFPCHVKMKFMAVLLGIPALFLINEVRIINIFYIGVHHSQYLEIAHHIVWQSLMIFATVMLWLYWAGKVVHYERT